MDSKNLVIKFEKVIDGDASPDMGLEQKVKLALGNTDLNDYIRDIVNRVFSAVDGYIEKVNYLGVRIVATDNPKCGWAFRMNKPNLFPSMIIGYAGNLAEFEKTIIHEILHYIDWDEYIVEKKTQEIFCREGRKE